MDFTDKVVLITGAASGIGAACALNFAKLSAKLSLIDRNEDSLKAVADQCEKEKGIKPVIIKAELTNDEEVKDLVEETVKQLGGIDVLVNNAGIAIVNGSQMERYDTMMAVNMRSPYLLTHLAMPHLKKSKGSVVNLASVSGLKNFEYFMEYCISKAAVAMFTKCMAQEYGPFGVRVNAVSPYIAKTPIFSHMSEEQVDAFIEEQNKQVPLKKCSTTDEIANVIIFLASDFAKSITGTNTVVDNGRLLV